MGLQIEIYSAAQGRVDVELKKIQQKYRFATNFPQKPPFIDRNKSSQTVRILSNWIENVCKRPNEKGEGQLLKQKMPVNSIGKIGNKLLNPYSPLG